MKTKVFIILLILINASGCQFANYNFHNSDTPSVEFSRGKWLLKSDDCPFEIRNQFKKVALKEFSKYIKKELHSFDDLKFRLLERLDGYIEADLDSSTLKNIKLSTNFNYLINLRAKINSQNVGSVIPARLVYSSENNVIVSVKIYDLDNLSTIYHQNVTATVSTDGNQNQELLFAKSSQSLSIAAFKKIMKEINKNK